MKKWLNEKIFTNNKKTLLFVGIITFTVLLIYQIFMLCLGTYFNSNSDDVAQYAPILTQYINYFKNGEFSWYNVTNNTGASIWADAYYVPLDIFTLITFLLSFIMNDIIAFSVANLIKVLFGVIVFCYYLQRKEFKNWLVTVLSLAYFCLGSSWTFAVFSTYFSLIFYLPLSLLIVDYFVKGKKWILPLYSCILVFYNFYNAYTLFIFMLFVFIVVLIRDNKEYKFKQFAIDVLKFGLHIVLGVVMGLVILLPSVLYILNYTIRNSFDFKVVYDFELYFKILYRLFVYESGVNTFASGNYIEHNFNLFVGYSGLFVLALLFFMKDRTSKIYKWSMFAVGVFMIFPIFSMIFSGVGVAYTRWFNFINIILLYLIGYVITNFDFKQLTNKRIKKVFFGILILYGVMFVSNIFIIVQNMKEDYYQSYNSLQLAIIAVLFLLFFCMYALFYVVKQRDLLFSMIALEMVIVLAINFSVSLKNENMELIEFYDDINNMLDKIDVNDEALERVYINNGAVVNVNRMSNSLMNEESFHSFFTKYYYNHVALYTVGENGLYTYRLDRLNPYESRIIDYKYVVVEKETEGINLDYLDVYYEDEEHVIYINNYYQPFYVYENYYVEQDLVNLNSEKRYLDFERKLFNGVVLSEDEYNLNKLEYNYEDSVINRIPLLQPVELNVGHDGKYEFDMKEYKLNGYEGAIYFKEENGKDVANISTIKGEEVRECRFLGGLYKCSFDGDVDKVVVDYHDNIEELSFMIEVAEHEKTNVLLKIDKEYIGDYLHYDVTASILELVMVDIYGNKRDCVKGICYVDDFDLDYIMLSDVTGALSNNNEYYFDYYYDNLEYYHLNKEDKLANNKSLSYNKSTIKVEYTRTSDSLNDQVIVLPVTYSEEWQINGDSENYELIRTNGKYLGVLVKNGVNEVNVSITFHPTGVEVGLIGSVIGFGIYGGYCYILFVRRKRKENETI